MDYIIIAIVCTIACNFVMPPIERYISQRIQKGWRRWIATFLAAIPVFCLFLYIAYLITGTFIQ